MIKRDTHKQEVAQVVWKVQVPIGATKGRPLASYDENGDSREIDSWEFKDGIIHVNFGIDPVVGELEYEYQVTDEDPVVIQGDGGVINIHVTQNNSPRP